MYDFAGLLHRNNGGGHLFSVCPFSFYMVTLYCNSICRLFVISLVATAPIVYIG